MKPILLLFTLALIYSCNTNNPFSHYEQFHPMLYDPHKQHYTTVDSLFTTCERRNALFFALVQFGYEPIMNSNYEIMIPNHSPTQVHESEFRANMTLKAMNPDWLAQNGYCEIKTN